MHTLVMFSAGYEARGKLFIDFDRLLDKPIFIYEKDNMLT